MSVRPLTPDERALVEQHLWLVDKLALRFQKRLPPQTDFDELRSAARHGLIAAALASNQDTRTFQSYARDRICGAMLDYLRSIDWCPRRARRLRGRIKVKSEELEQKLGREVSVDEVCSELAETESDFLRLRRAAAYDAPRSFDRPLYDDGTSLGGLIADQSNPGAPELLEQRELMEAMVAELEKLPDIQRKILALYYFEKLRLREIGEALQLTESRISQIVRKALATLRRRMHRHNEQRKIERMAPVLPDARRRESDQRDNHVSSNRHRRRRRPSRRTGRLPDDRMEGSRLDAPRHNPVLDLHGVGTEPNPGTAETGFAEHHARELADAEYTAAMNRTLTRDAAWWIDFSALTRELEFWKSQSRAKQREILRLNSLLSPSPSPNEAVAANDHVKPFVRSSRGAVDPITLGAIAIVAVVLTMSKPSGGPGKDHWWQFWRKNPVVQVDKSRAELDAAKQAAAAAQAAEQAKIDQAKAAQLKLAQEAAIATGSAIAAAQVVNAAGKPPTKELETAAAVNRTNTQAMEQAIGAADPARVRELEIMVANLNNGMAAGTKALELMQGTLDRTVADKAAATAELAKVKAAGDAKIADLERRFDAKQKELQAFALERDGLARRYEQLTFWGKLAGLAFAAVVLYVVLLLLRTHKLGNFVKDSVGMTEMLKDEIEKRAKPEEYAAIKERMANDWMTAHDGMATIVAKTKAALRL